jgi:hypothetical protein
MADNTKMPPNQDQRRGPQGDNKQQKPGGSVPASSNPGSRTDMNPGKPTPEMDPDRDRQDRSKPGAPGKPEEKIDIDDIEDDDMPIDRE